MGAGGEPFRRLEAGEEADCLSDDAAVSGLRAGADGRVQANGAWIVVTNPAAYSDDEKQFLEDIKAVCRTEKIPLFICRGAELPNGWKRYDQ